VNSPRPSSNLAQLLELAERLGDLLDRVVFVGGCVTDLLITDPAAAPVRPTLDVDAIVAVSSYSEFISLENKLRVLGFEQPHTEGAPICRWRIGRLIFDVMPTDLSVLGLTNRWYQPAFENSQRMQIGNFQVALVTAPYFLATKLEAFHGRGKNDFRSHDLEDIIAVVDGRPELADEVRVSSQELQQYLRTEISQLLLNNDFLEVLPGHLLPDAASQQRLRLVLNRMRQLTQIV
jgi:predicted nucleotidyltransferase